MSRFFELDSPLLVPIQLNYSRLYKEAAYKAIIHFIMLFEKQLAF
jgi:hypothetical protein